MLFGRNLILKRFNLLIQTGQFPLCIFVIDIGLNDDRTVSRHIKHHLEGRDLCGWI